MCSFTKVSLQSFQSEPVPGLDCGDICQCQFVPPTAKPFCCACALTYVLQCFPSSAHVILENGENIAMSKVQTGDKVQTGMDSLSV